MSELADMQLAHGVLADAQQDLRRWERMYKADRGRDASRYLARIRAMERKLELARENVRLLAGAGRPQNRTESPL
jgi:hypothetical protein